MKRTKDRERRSGARDRRNGALYWRLRRLGEFRMGWLLESSSDSFAFAWRGDLVPTLNTIIEVQVDGQLSGNAVQRAIVRRTQAVHDDLYVIAAQMLTDFPANQREHARALPPVDCVPACAFAPVFEFANVLTGDVVGTGTIT